MRLPMPIDDAWRALVALPPTRGELAGYTGTAVLEEADDDVHVAVFRLQGSAGTAMATATLTAGLAPASDGTSLAFELDLHPGPGAELTRESVLAALGEIVPAARAAGEAAARAAAEAARGAAARAAAEAARGAAAPPSSPPAAPPSSPPATPGSARPPGWSETVEWVEPREPVPARVQGRRSPSTGALVAAGAAAALAAWALRRRS
jgi:hypothetical protein